MAKTSPATLVPIFEKTLEREGSLGTNKFAPSKQVGSSQEWEAAGFQAGYGKKSVSQPTKKSMRRHVRLARTAGLDPNSVLCGSRRQGSQRGEKGMIG